MPYLRIYAARILIPVLTGEAIIPGRIGRRDRKKFSSGARLSELVPAGESRGVGIRVSRVEQDSEGS